MSSQESKTPAETKAPEPPSESAPDATSQASETANSWSKDKRRKFESKSQSEWFDPCQEAAQRSYKCIFRNGGDKSFCGDYFQAYRDCKQKWTEERKKKTGAWF